MEYGGPQGQRSEEEVRDQRKRNRNGEGTARVIINKASHESQEQKELQLVKQ